MTTENDTGPDIPPSIREATELRDRMVEAVHAIAAQASHPDVAEAAMLATARELRPYPPDPDPAPPAPGELVYVQLTPTEWVRRDMVGALALVDLGNGESAIVVRATDGDEMTRLKVRTDGAEADVAQVLRSLSTGLPA